MKVVYAVDVKDNSGIVIDPNILQDSASYDFGQVDGNGRLYVNHLVRVRGRKMKEFANRNPEYGNRKENNRFIIAPVFD